mmetsp:Transcript_16645/g.52082  ORF Transcript_16645/g.52082 Transcript_16645/m.52082 type:complete len:328 (+) Transcript_16645:191-1174(+)
MRNAKSQTASQLVEQSEDIMDRGKGGAKLDESGALDEHVQIAVLLPVGDVVEVVKPLVSLELDPGIVHGGPEGGAREVVLREGFDGFAEGPREILDSLLVELGLRQGVEVEGVWGTRVEAVLDASEAGGEDHGADEVGIVAGIGEPEFEAAGSGDAYGVCAIVVAVDDVEGGPREARHGALLDKALVAVDRGAGDGGDSGEVSEDAGAELVGELGHAEAVRVGGVLEDVGLRGEVVHADVEVGARAGPIAHGLGHPGRVAAVLARDGVGHGAKEDEAVGHLAGLAEVEVDLDLAEAVLVVKGVDPPVELLHRVDELVEPGHVVEESH